tara:strand:+ start:649 stop:2160 length:1512 start_codon:yes stop_codon:yes gene_type:complete
MFLFVHVKNYIFEMWVLKIMFSKFLKFLSFFNKQHSEHLYNSSVIHEKTSRDFSLNEKKGTNKFVMGAACSVFLSAIVLSIFGAFNINAKSRSAEMHANAEKNFIILTNNLEPKVLGELSLSSNTSYQNNTFKKTLYIKKGSNLTKTLIKAGIKPIEAFKSVESLKGKFNTRNIIAGQPVEILIHKNTGTLLSLYIKHSPEKIIKSYLIDNNSFFSNEETILLKKFYSYLTGTIDTSLFVATRSAGVPIPVVMEMVNIFSWDIDFQRDIHPDDKFEILFEVYKNHDGKNIKHGNILFSSLTTRGEKLDLYRHKLENGKVDYFNNDGESAKKALLKTPVNGARLSSRYGKRRHPVLGYTRMHRGIDFAAPRGTPIRAAGDGRIELAKRNGGYGKYVRIRHNNNYKTAYAHLKSYARGIRPGTRVKQGQVIGFVGTTGVSTGPHLHYEIHRNGKQINPLKLRLPKGQKLKGLALTKFYKDIESISSILKIHDYYLASNGSNIKTN